MAKAAGCCPVHAESKRLVGVMLMRLQLLFYSALSVVLSFTHTQKHTLSLSFARLTSFVVVDLPPVFSFHRFYFNSLLVLLTEYSSFLAISFFDWRLPCARPTRFSFAWHRTPPSLLADPAINATTSYTSLPSSSSPLLLGPKSPISLLPLFLSLCCLSPRGRAARGCCPAGTISLS